VILIIKIKFEKSIIFQIAFLMFISAKTALIIMSLNTLKNKQCEKLKNINNCKFYLLFLIIIAKMMLSILVDDDLLDTSIYHFIFDQFIISFEHSLNALELNTFYDMNC